MTNWKPGVCLAVLSMFLTANAVATTYQAGAIAEMKAVIGKLESGQCRCGKKPGPKLPE